MNSNPQTEEEWTEYFKEKSDSDVCVFKKTNIGAASQKAATTVWLAREKKIRDDDFQRHKELAESKQEREKEHTLWVYWKLANWRERFGIIGFLSLVFMLGFGAAQIPSLTKFLNLIKSLIP